MSTTARLVLGVGVLLACALALTQTMRPASGQAPPASGELVGSLPASDGFALAVWGGGSAEQLAIAAAARGCNLAAVWVTEQGSFIGYVPSAPAVVNQVFLAQFPGATLP